jgi:tricorn protease
VDGRRVSETVSLQEALVQRSGREVELGITSADDGVVRTVTVELLHSERQARYREWVADNRAYVHDETDGDIGYVHIPDMGPRGYAEFHRGFLAEKSKDGLIVDVRFNGGGHVSQLILEKLGRQRLGYDVVRWRKPNPYPEDSMSGPLVALTNQHAGSDGDIFSHCFKEMELGPLLGTRTWGGVVGIWPRHRLADGSVTTQPEFSFWFDDVGFGIENHGTEPDRYVERPPEVTETEADPQLEAAVEEALDRLDRDAPEYPDFAPFPNLKPPESLDGDE